MYVYMYVCLLNTIHLLKNVKRQQQQIYIDNILLKIADTKERNAKKKKKKIIDNLFDPFHPTVNLSR